MILTEQIISTKNIWQRIRYLNPLVYNENKTNLKILKNPNLSELEDASESIYDFENW